MITVNNFGPSGRLGNQIFQFALLFGLHKLHGYEIHLPLNNGCEFWKCFDIKNIKLYDYLIRDDVNTFKETLGYNNYDDCVLQQPDNTEFYGYFQSYLYFDRYRSELIDCLNFHNDIIEKSDNILSGFKGPLISIHVRRGDYIDHPQWGDLIKEGYYEKAIEDINDSEEVLVFSDDIDFIKDYFKTNKNFNIIDEDEYVSLCMMTKCERHIIANSSFSWMGAYLSGKDNVTCPETWLPSLFPKPNDIQKDITKQCWNKIKSFI